MRIREVTSRSGRDFSALMECEHCDHTHKLTTGYDDGHYFQNVIPAITCGGCGKNRAGEVPAQRNDNGALHVPATPTPSLRPSAGGHAPGPWEVHHVEYGSEVTDDLMILSAPDCRDVARVTRCFSGDRIHWMEQANARLIAASPALLALAEAVVAAWDHFERIGPGCTFENGPMIHASTLEELADSARAAIAAAKGETP